MLPDSGSLISVDFDEDKAKGLLRQLPRTNGYSSDGFRGREGTGKVYGPYGEQVRLVIDRIEKIEHQEHHPRPNRNLNWVPQNCDH